jgi:hypothetical protein
LELVKAKERLIRCSVILLMGEFYIVIYSFGIFYVDGILGRVGSLLLSEINLVNS